MDLITSAVVSVAITLAVVALLAAGPLRRAPQTVMLVLGAFLAVVIAAAVFFGAAGGGFAFLCAGGVIAAGGLLYLLLWLMERWARGGGE